MSEPKDAAAKEAQLVQSMRDAAAREEYATAAEFQQQLKQLRAEMAETAAAAAAAATQAPKAADPSAESAVAGTREFNMSFQWSDGTGESDFNSLLGKRVKLVGLQGRPELNGRVGRVYSWHEDKGRAGIMLDDGEEGTLAIKPENLAAMPDKEPVADDEPAADVEEPAVDAERLEKFYTRATDARGAMSRETAKSHQKHAALRQAVGEAMVTSWYDEHQQHVEEQRLKEAQAKGLLPPTEAELLRQDLASLEP